MLIYMVQVSLVHVCIVLCNSESVHNVQFYPEHSLIGQSTWGFLEFINSTVDIFDIFDVVSYQV